MKLNGNPGGPLSELSGYLTICSPLSVDIETRTRTFVYDTRTIASGPRKYTNTVQKERRIPG